LTGDRTNFPAVGREDGSYIQIKQINNAIGVTFIDARTGGY
jgi:hypothetical protein